MPIFEFQCKSCQSIIGVLVMKPEDEKGITCDQCGSKRLNRILSRFTTHKTESRRLKDFDAHAPRDESFYKDSRNIGMWAKKRASELGADLGSGFDEVVEKARTSKFPEDLDG